jgi:hypothetical protein
MLWLAVQALLSYANYELALILRGPNSIIHILEVM